LEEIKMYEDIPQAVVAELYDQIALGNNSLGRKISGTAETVKSITKDEMLSFKSSHYSYQNAVVAIAGNFQNHKENEIVAEIEMNFKLEKKTVLAEEKLLLPTGCRIEIKQKKIEQSNIIIGFIGPSLKDTDWPAARVLTKILGGSMSSRMFMEVREKLGLAYHIETDINFFTDTGLFGTFAGVDNNQVYRATEAIIEQYQKMTEEVVSTEELERAKEMLCGKLLIEMEDSEELACGYAFDELLTGRIETIEETIAKYRAVTKENILDCAIKYFKMDEIVFAGVGPKIDKEKIRNITSTDSFH